MADIGSQYFITFPAHGFAAAYSGDILGRPVEGSDPEILVHGEGAVGNGVEDQLAQGNFLAQGLLGGDILEGFHPADDLAALIAQGRSADADG